MLKNLFAREFVAFHLTFAESHLYSITGEQQNLYLKTSLIRLKDIILFIVKKANKPEGLLILVIRDDSCFLVKLSFINMTLGSGFYRHSGRVKALFPHSSPSLIVTNWFSIELFSWNTFCSLILNLSCYKNRNTEIVTVDSSSSRMRDHCLVLPHFQVGAIGMCCHVIRRRSRSKNWTYPTVTVNGSLSCENWLNS